MNYQAVFFDFDYTLGDATPSIYEGFCYAMKQMGKPQPTLEAVRHTVGNMLEDSYTILTGDGEPAHRMEFRRWFQRKVEGTQAAKTQILPGARELLTALRDRGVKLGIITSKRETTLRDILERHGLAPLLDFTVGGEGVSAPKPDPQGLNAAIAAVGADRERVLYCGDTVIDAATAQNAGVDFAAVLGGTTPREAFGPYPSVCICPDLPALRDWLFEARE